MIWSEYCGYWAAMSSAPANDFVSWLWTLLLIVSLFGAAAMAVAAAEAYPAVNRAPMVDCMIAPPRSRCRSAVPDAMPTRCTGTDPVSEFEDGVPASPTPIPTRMYGIATSQYGVSSFQSTNMPRKARNRMDCPRRSVARDPCEPTSFAERGATRT